MNDPPAEAEGIASNVAEMIAAKQNRRKVLVVGSIPVPPEYKSPEFP